MASKKTTKASKEYKAPKIYKGFKFISKPRCASNSMHEILETEFQDNHLSFSEIYKKHGLNGMKNQFVFGFVRNPFSLLASWFFYHVAISCKPYTDYDLSSWVLDGCKCHWEEAGLKEDPLTQWKYLCDSKGNLKADFVGRFESLHEDWEEVCKTLKIEHVPLPRLAPSSAVTSKRKIFSDKAIAYIKKKYAKDFELFYPEEL